jgi:hypothetical protein
MAIEARVTKQGMRSLEVGIGSTGNGIMIGAHAEIDGFGSANVLVGLTAPYFRELAEAMMTVNPEEASKAFGHALKDGVSAKREFKRLGLTSAEEMRASADKVIREHGLLARLIAKSRLRRS